MKRFLALLIIFSLFALPCHAGVTGAVSLANSRLSLVDGTAFVDFSAAGTLTPYLNHRLTLTDSAGKKAVGYIKAAGTGETLDSEILDAWTNNGANPFETFTTSGSDITQAVNSTGVGVAYKVFSVVNGALYKYTNTYSKTSGADPYLRTVRTSSLIDPVVSLTRNGITYVVGVATQDRIAVAAVTTSDFALINNSLKQVLTPSATGVTITSTPGGTTYNWASIESGFNYNDAGGYSFYVTTSSSGIYKRRMRLLKR